MAVAAEGAGSCPVFREGSNLEGGVATAPGEIIFPANSSTPGIVITPLQVWLDSGYPESFGLQQSANLFGVISLQLDAAILERTATAARFAKLL